MIEKIGKKIVSLGTRALALMQKESRLRQGVLVLLLAIIGLQGFRVAGHQQKQTFFIVGSRSDFDDYYQAAGRFRRGEDPYRISQVQDIKAKEYSLSDLRDPQKLREIVEGLQGVGSYLYLPFTAYLLQGISLLSYFQASILFQVLSLLALVLFLRILHERVRVGSIPASAYYPSAILSILILFSFLQGNATNGNVVFFLILLTGYGLLLSFRSSFLLEIAGGFLIGIATVMKVTPGFLGLVLLSGRRFRAIVGMGIGVLFGLLLPSLTFGFSHNLEMLRNWYVLVLENYNKLGIVRPWHNNQTLSAAVGKLFLPGSDPIVQSRFGLPFIFSDHLPTLAQAHAIVAGVRIANLFLIGSGLIVALRTAFLWRRGQERESLSYDVQMVRMTFFALLLSLLTSGVSWYHAYAVLFVPVYFRLEQHFSKGPSILSGERISLWSLSFFGLMQSLFSSRARDFFAIYSWLTALALGMVAYLAIVLWKESGKRDGI